jgi:hypothetical protein
MSKEEESIETIETEDAPVTEAAEEAAAPAPEEPETLAAGMVDDEPIEDQFDFDDPSDEPPADDSDEVATKDEESVEETPSPAPISETLRSAARDMGLTDAMIDASSRDDLEAFVLRDSKKTETAPTKAEGPEPFDLSKVEGVDLDLVEPETVKIVEAMQKFYDAQFEAQRQKVDALLDTFEQQATLQEVSRFDAMIGDLGKGWVKQFGEGPSEKLATGTDMRANRDKLWDAYERQAHGYEARGEKVPDEAQLFNEALRVAFGDQIETMATTRVRDSIRKREKRLVNRPTHREGSEQTGKAAAVAWIGEFMKERGADEFAEYGADSL